MCLHTVHRVEQSGQAVQFILSRLMQGLNILKLSRRKQWLEGTYQIEEKGSNPDSEMCIGKSSIWNTPNLKIYIEES